MLQPNQKTPTIYSGVKPDSYNFEEIFYNWSKKQQLEYMEYMERDANNYAMKLGCFFGIIIGIIIGILSFSFFR